MAYLLDSQQKVWILFKFGFRNKSQSLDFLRHSLATTMLENGVPLPVISQTLGHADIASTEVYLRINIGQLRLCALEVEL